MIVGHGLVRPIYLEEFIKLMSGRGFDEDELSAIYNDIERRSYEEAEYIEFDVEELEKEYYKKHIIYAQNEEEFKEFMDNKELGLRLYKKSTGGFIEDWIKDEYILTSNVEYIVYKIPYKEDDEYGEDLGQDDPDYEEEQD